MHWAQREKGCYVGGVRGAVRRDGIEIFGFLGQWMGTSPTPLAIIFKLLRDFLRCSLILGIRMSKPEHNVLYFFLVASKLETGVPYFIWLQEDRKCEDGSKSRFQSTARRV